MGPDGGMPEGEKAEADMLRQLQGEAEVHMAEEG